MASRRNLTGRRFCQTFNIEVEGLHYTCSAGRFEDGALAEVFLNNHKAGSAADVNARDAAIVCSLALQYGADVETIRNALCRDSQGRPSGPLAAALDMLAQTAI